MVYSFPRVLPAGDSAILVVFGDQISPVANARVRALDAALASADLPGIVETVPAYCSLLVEYDSLSVSFSDIEPHVARIAQHAGDAPPQAAPLKRVPAVYGGEFGPDLVDVAAVHGLTTAQVIAIHTGTIYTVYMLGFSPGFSYMGQVPETIATPRLASPRPRVPAGSVALAARQTGVYPQSTPGGWRILGRTGLTLFDPGRDPACFFQPGDRVQFVPVSAQDMDTPVPFEQPPVSGGSIEILAPGLLTTVQDLGRYGQQRYGVPVAGAMDAFALRAANALVGNPPDAPALEMTLAGPSLLFNADSLIAITGADLEPVLHTPDLEAWRAPLSMALYVRRGSRLEFMGRQSGCRAYLAVAGGIIVPRVMGSASTYMTGAFGGYRGRALQVGDHIPVGASTRHLPTLAGRSLRSGDHPPYAEHPTVRVVLGPQDDYFTVEAVDALLSEAYSISTTSDRMGLRLQGPPLVHRGAPEIISNGMTLGAIQVPPNAQPIILTADRQTVGGYPVIATVIRADMPLLAQCVPGVSRVRFQSVTLEQARSAYRTMCLRSRLLQSPLT